MYYFRLCLHDKKANSWSATFCVQHFQLIDRLLLPRHDSLVRFRTILPKIFGCGMLIGIDWFAQFKKHKSIGQDRTLPRLKEPLQAKKKRRSCSTSPRKQQKQIRRSDSRPRERQAHSKEPTRTDPPMSHRLGPSPLPLGEARREH